MTDGDLRKLGFVSKPNPHKKDWSAMCLYLQSQVCFHLFHCISIAISQSYRRILIALAACTIAVEAEILSTDKASAVFVS